MNRAAATGGARRLCVQKSLLVDYLKVNFFLAG
jgi:hypothetical protein